MIYKLFRRDCFDNMHIYFLEGNKEEMFSFIGYVYSCLDGTKRIDYKRVSSIPNDVVKCVATCSEYKKFYYRYVGVDKYGEV